MKIQKSEKRTKKKYAFAKNEKGTKYIDICIANNIEAHGKRRNGT